MFHAIKLNAFYTQKYCATLRKVYKQRLVENKAPRQIWKVDIISKQIA
jgi:hypothetical protein